MKNTKKVLMICLFAVLAMGMVFGSPKQEDSDEKVVLNIMGHGDSAGQEGQGFLRIVKSFMEEYPHIEIVSEVLFDEGFHQKATARIASGDIPDVVYMGSDGRWGGRWKEAGQQIEMVPYIDADLFDTSLFGGVDNEDGDFLYIPLGTANMTTVAMANVELIKSLGFELPTTYEEMVAMVPAAKAAGIQVFETHGAAGWVWGSCVFSTIIAQASGDADWPQKLLDGKAKFTDPEFVAALEFLQTMVADGVMSKDVVLVDHGTNFSNFNNGKTLITMSGQWDVGAVSLELQETMQLLAFPAIPGAKGETDTIAATKSPGYGITKAAVDRGVTDAAMLFIEYYNSREEVAQRYRDGAIVAAVLTDFDAPTDVPPAVTLKGKLAVSIAGVTQVIDSFITGATNDSLNVGLQEVVSGGKTPQQLADQLQAEWENQNK